MSKWSEFYADRIGNGYARYCNNRYAAFIHEILKRLPDKGSRITSYNLREEGCGIATITRILASRYLPHSSFECFDDDVAQCFNASENLSGLTRKKIYVDNILRENHRKPAHPIDMIFGHGVLEHFSGSDIEKIISRQKSEAKYVVHYVPTDGYDKPSFGDENLMSVNWWLSNFQPDEYVLFNEDKDLVLVWQQENKN